MFSQLMVCSNFCSLQRVGCSLSGPSLVFCHYCVVAGLVGCVATLSSAFAALAATTAALAAFAADVASQLGFVGLGVRCFAFRDLQSHCRRAHGHRFHSLPSFAATTASFFWDSGGFWSLRVFVSTRTRPSWPWSPLRLFALSLSNLSVRAHTHVRVHTHVQVRTCASHAHGHSHSLLPTFLILYLPTARHAQ